MGQKNCENLRKIQFHIEIGETGWTESLHEIEVASEKLFRETFDNWVMIQLLWSDFRAYFRKVFSTKKVVLDKSKNIAINYFIWF